MALKLVKFEINTDEAVHRIEHNLNTKDLVISVWKNNLLITPSVEILDNNTVALYNLTGKNANVVIVGQTVAKTRNTNVTAKPKSAKPRTAKPKSDDN